MSGRTGCPGASVNLGTDRAAAIGEQPAISGAPLGDSSDSPIRGLGDFASAAPDPLIRKGGCPRQRDGPDRRLSFRTFPEGFLDAPMGAGGARAGG